MSHKQDLFSKNRLHILTYYGGACGNVIGGDDCVGVMVSGNLVTVTVTVTVRVRQ